MSDCLRQYAVIIVLTLVVTGMIVPGGVQATDGTERAGADERPEYGTAGDDKNGSSVTHPFSANKSRLIAALDRRIQRVHATGVAATENHTDKSELGLSKPTHEPPANSSDGSDDSEDSVGDRTAVNPTSERNDASQQAGDDDRFEPNDDFSSATPLDIRNGDTEITAQTTDDASDVFAVDVAEGERIDVEVLFSHSEADIDLALYSPDQNFITNSISVTDNERVSHVASQSGRYYIEVYGFSGGPAEYTLQVATNDTDPADLSPDRFEPNDAIRQAAVLDEGTYNSLTLTTNDVDIYGVEVERGQNIQVDIAFDHDRADLNMVALGPDEGVRARAESETDGESITIRDAQQSGRYYFAVFSTSERSAEYNLAVNIDDAEPSDRFEPNDALETAAPIQPGTVQARIGGGDDTDFYQIAANADTEFSVSISFDHDQNDLDLFLFDNDGQVIDESISVSDGERVSASNLNGGTYYVAVVPRDETSIDYTLTLERESAPTQDRFEPNDLPETATPINSGAYNGLTLPAGDVDAYRLELEAGQSVEAALFPDEPLDERTGVRLDLFYRESQDEALERVTGTSATGSSTQIEIRDLSRSGTYFIVVFNNQNGSTSRLIEYELGVDVSESTSQNDRFEPNNQVSTATPINAGTYDRLRLVPGEIDAYTVDRAAGESIDVTIVPDEPLDGNAVTVQLFYQTGPETARPVTDQQLVTGNETSLGIDAVERSGTYHIAVISSEDRVVDYLLAVDDPTGDPDARSVDVRLRPADGPATGPISQGTARTYEIITTNATRGVGAYQFVVETDDPGVATIANLRPRGLTDSSIIETSVASDGSAATVVASNTDTGTGTVVVAEVIVLGETPGSATLDLRLLDGNPPGDENGNSYTVGIVSGTNVTVSERTGPGDLTGNGAPATDPDGDGVYEDINGDGSVSSSDVTALFELLSSGEVPGDGSQLDINGANDGVTAADVTALFNEVVPS